MPFAISIKKDKTKKWETAPFIFTNQERAELWAKRAKTHWLYAYRIRKVKREVTT